MEFDWGYGTLGSPVDPGGVVSRGQIFDSRFWHGWHLHESVELLNLLSGSVSEMVNSKSPGKSFGIVFFMFCNSFLEDVGSEFVLSLGTEGSSILLDEGNEFVIIFSHELRSGRSSSSEGGSSNNEFHNKVLLI